MRRKTTGTQHTLRERIEKPSTELLLVFIIINAGCRLADRKEINFPWPRLKRKRDETVGHQ